MAVLRQIRKRITSVKNTQQITKAMKMVSAAKLRKAQQELENIKSYSEHIIKLLRKLRSRIDEEELVKLHPLLKVKDEKRIQYLIITSDRGLCGGFNHNLLRKTYDYIKKNRNQGKENLLSIIGKKGVDFFKKREGNIVKEYSNYLRNVSYSFAKEVASFLIKDFISENCDSIYCIYNEFVTSMSQKVIIQKILPIEFEDSQVPEKIDYIYEPSKEEILKELLPKYVITQIYRAILESVASEHGARMSAMDSATNNATKMIGKLTLLFNRTRQAVITKELMDIINGSEALR